jgi:hypothetical protein
MKGLRTGHHEGQDEKGWDRTGRYQDIFLHLQMMTCMLQSTFRPDYGKIFARPVDDSRAQWSRLRARVTRVI